MGGKGAGRSGRVEIGADLPRVGRRLERLHHFEHMKRQLAAGAMRPAGADRLRHVGEADDAVVAVGVGALGRDFAPVFGSSRQLDLAAEIVRVGNDERAGLAIEFDRSVPVPRDVEAHCHRDRRSARERQRPGDVRGDLDGNARTRERLAGDETLGPGSGRNAADARHRPEEIDEVGDIIGSHVEHRAAAGEVIEAGIGMPALMARAHEERRAADRPADQPFVDGAARGLVGAAEKRVRRAAEP